NGGPGGLGTLAAAPGEEQGALEGIYEAFLIQIGFFGRTPRGGMGTRPGYEHFRILYGRPPGVFCKAIAKHLFAQPAAACSNLLLLWKSKIAIWANCCSGAILADRTTVW